MAPTCPASVAIRRAVALALAIGVDASRILDWCIAFAGMTASELASDSNNSDVRIRTLLALATHGSLDELRTDKCRSKRSGRSAAPSGMISAATAGDGSTMAAQRKRWPNSPRAGSLSTITHYRRARTPRADRAFFPGQCQPTAYRP
jgi:hypothetical protein